MEETKDLNQEEIKEEIVEKEVSTENPSLEEKQKNNSKKISPRKSKMMLYIVLILVVILFGLLGFLAYDKYPDIAKKLRTNKYGIDYNINKISSYDWDTVLTDKKISRALGISQKLISSAKNPDWEWILNDQATFSKEVICGSLIDEKVLNEENNDAKSLINVNVMICSNTGKANELYTARKEDIKSISASDSKISVKTMLDEKGIGENAYYYVINRENEPAEKDAKPTTDIFSGLIFERGPFLVRLEESEQAGGAKLSTEKFRNTLAKLIDQELKRSLSAF